MNHTNSPSCSDDNLRLLLDGDESDQRYREAATHVETCLACQRRLTELSADTDFWHAQQEMLSPLEGDLSETGTLVRHRSMDSWNWHSHAIEESAIKEMLSPPSHPEMLGRLGRYEIERVIGAGGMGIVLKGFDSELNRPVAIKLLAPHLARIGAARQRFAREARAAAAVAHENVVPIHNVESDHAQPFLVMQFITGESLQARVDREGPLSVPEILRIGLQAASGLAAAHAQGLVHRDVKPANILLEDGVERVYLTDFGLARTTDDASLTYTGTVAGTPHYMSPEQADGRPLDHRSDLFSLGSVLYFMATGHPPFRADRPMGVLKRTCHDPHRPVWEHNAEIPDALSAIIDRLLEKDPNRRFASAAQVQTAMEAVLAQVQQGRLRQRRRRLTRWPKLRWKTGSLVAGLVAALLMTVFVAASLLEFLQDRTAGKQPPIAPPVAPEASAAPSSNWLDQLRSLDPSPPDQSQEELNSLEESLDQLEVTPFPETVLPANGE